MESACSSMTTTTILLANLMGRVFFWIIAEYRNSPSIDRREVCKQNPQRNINFFFFQQFIFEFENGAIGRLDVASKRIDSINLCVECPILTENGARELVQQFINSAFDRRELLVSLIERVELTADKEIIIKFRFQFPNSSCSIE